MCIITKANVNSKLSMQQRNFLYNISNNRIEAITNLKKEISSDLQILYSNNFLPELKSCGMIDFHYITNASECKLGCCPQICIESIDITARGIEIARYLNLLQP